MSEGDGRRPRFEIKNVRQLPAGRDAPGVPAPVERPVPPAPERPQRITLTPPRTESRASRVEGPIIDVEPIADVGSRRAEYPTVGIIGHSQAGKTSLLAVLTRALTAAGYDHSVLSQVDNAYLDDVTSAIDNGHFPLKTQVAERSSRVQVRVRQREGGAAIQAAPGATHRREFNIDMFDPPGELFDRQDGLEERNPQIREFRRQVISDLRASTGMMILLDLARSVDFLKALIDRVVAQVDSSRLDRVAVMFTKADLVPWQARYRARSARGWIEDDEQSAYRDVCARLQASFRQVEYFFASAVGWSYGAVNLSTVVNAVDHRALTELSRGLDADDRPPLHGEYIPDPALFRNDTRATARRGGEVDASTQDGYMRNLPLFTDPLRCVPRDFRNRPLPQGGYGVHSLPGRSSLVEERERRTTDRVRAWNVAEPVLWAAGLDLASTSAFPPPSLEPQSESEGQSSRRRRLYQRTS